MIFFLCSQVARLGGKSGGLITHSPFRGTCADVLIRACISSFGISDSSSIMTEAFFFRQTLLKVTYTILWINGRGLWHCHSHWQIYDFTNHIIIWSVIHSRVRLPLSDFSAICWWCQNKFNVQYLSNMAFLATFCFISLFSDLVTLLIAMP